MSSLQKLKIERARAESKITRLIDVLDPKLNKQGSEASEIQDDVLNQAAKLRDGLDQFEKAHKKYAESLESETDD